MSAHVKTTPSKLISIESLPYRPCVGIMLIAKGGQVFTARRIDTPNGWQMPQGGINPGESPAVAALRELKEEIGTDYAELLAETAGCLRYDLPDYLIGKAWKGRYRGQEQKWFAARFTGVDADIDLTANKHPEFDAWRWVPVESLTELIVPFKRAIYQAVVEEFRPLLTRLKAEARR
ncbi:RNA pyrophosphohydrolase [uncultured Gammaproteobacteria bacterium]